MRIYDEDDERVSAWLVVWYMVWLAYIAVIVIKHLL